MCDNEVGLMTHKVVCDNEVGLITHKVVFCQSHWWGAIAGHRGFESLGANLSDVSSCSDVPFYPSEARGFLSHYPYPLPI
jgi:hypothetical protein